VMILPYRNPVLTAKMLATIDVLSQGRVTVGVGVGWLREEFEALDSPDFDRRGAASDEYLRIFKTLWTQNPASFAGEFYRFEALRCLPQPVQKPHPPIWIGANRPQLGLPLVGRQADVWHGWGSGYSEKWEVVRRAAEKAGRDPDQIVRSSSLSISEPWDEVRQSFETHVANGVSYLIVGWPSEGRKRLDEFIENVLPDLR
jgi:alkanesulfonate monooxygenase SsuD/methylene tetrahydromethanopterin reductase-like flavin-dependent oxidoreductase (luciferase family)